MDNQRDPCVGPSTGMQPTLMLGTNLKPLTAPQPACEAVTVFEGIEAEGRLRGVRTHFVRGYDRYTILSLLTTSSHVFLGAKGYILSDGELQDLLDLLEGATSAGVKALVTLHHPLTKLSSIPAPLMGLVHLMLYMRLPGASLLSIKGLEVKMEDSRTAVIMEATGVVSLDYLYDTPTQTPKHPAAAASAQS